MKFNMEKTKIQLLDAITYTGKASFFVLKSALNSASKISVDKAQELGVWVLKKIPTLIGKISLNVAKGLIKTIDDFFQELLDPAKQSTFKNKIKKAYEQVEKNEKFKNNKSYGS